MPVPYRRNRSPKPTGPRPSTPARTAQASRSAVRSSVRGQGGASPATLADVHPNSAEINLRIDRGDIIPGNYCGVPDLPPGVSTVTFSLPTAVVSAPVAVTTSADIAYTDAHGVSRQLVPVAKTITVNPRRGHPLPNLVRRCSPSGPGLVNCNGFQNPGLEAFRASISGLPHRVPLIVSVAGESVEDYVALVCALAPLGDLVEINISSPNTRLVYAWNERPRELRALLEALATASPRPLIVKLSPDFTETNEQDIIPAALDAGVGIVNYGNTRRIDEPRLSQGTGGLSGPEIFAATLDNLRRTRKRFGDALEIVATGGVDAPDKAAALLDEGARAVGYFTGFVTRGPILARLILERLVRRP